MIDYADLFAILAMALYMLMASAGHIDMDEIKRITEGEYDERNCN